MGSSALIRSHRSLTHLLRTAHFARSLVCSRARGTVNYFLPIYKMLWIIVEFITYFWMNEWIYLRKICGSREATWLTIAPCRKRVWIQRQASIPWDPDASNPASTRQQLRHRHRKTRCHRDQRTVADGDLVNFHSTLTRSVAVCSYFKFCFLGSGICSKCLKFVFLLLYFTLIKKSVNITDMGRGMNEFKKSFLCSSGGFAWKIGFCSFWANSDSPESLFLLLCL